jgi:hypothetical protein
VYRLANAVVRPATAYVAAHRAVDVAVGGLRLLFEERNGGHDLPRLAIAALHDVGLDPRPLYRM